MSVAAGEIRARVTELRRSRPRSAFVRGSLMAFTAFLVASWLLRDFDWGDLLSPRRRANVARFLGEIRPFPLHDRAWDWHVAWTWAREILTEKGLRACAVTLAISICAIELAGLVGLVLAPFAARNFASAEPFLPGPREPGRWRRGLWRGCVAATRVLFILARAIPEYVWAFIFVAIFGASAWPAILALALHNAGILGRLGAESIENTGEDTLAALRGLGANRLQIAGVGLFPAVLPRFLLYFFYRWETCVREATILGMLPGIAALGSWIVDARVRLQYDTLVFLVLLGASLVLVGDLVSALARHLVRRAS